MAYVVYVDDLISRCQQTNNVKTKKYEQAKIPNINGSRLLNCLVNCLLQEDDDNVVTNPLTAFC